MADELENELNNPSEVEKRIKSLSGKVKEEAELKEKALADKAEAENKIVETQRERDFYVGFSDVVATNPSAKDYKDDILAKVKSGYTVEDATFAVLGKAGKLNQAPVESVNPAGGSASITLPNGGTKSTADMTQAERRAELEKILEVS